MYALVRLFVRCWLWLLPEQGRPPLGWERLRETRPNERPAGRWASVAAAARASPRRGLLSASELAAAPPQHAAPSSLNRRLRRLLQAGDWRPPAPLLLHTLPKSLGWHRACPLAHMAELEQPGRAGVVATTAGCAAQSLERGFIMGEKDLGVPGVEEEDFAGVQEGPGHPPQTGEQECHPVQDGHGCNLMEQVGGGTVGQEEGDCRGLEGYPPEQEAESRPLGQERCVPEAETPPAGCALESPAVEEGCLGDSGLGPPPALEEEGGGRSSRRERRLDAGGSSAGSESLVPLRGVDTLDPGVGSGVDHPQAGSEVTGGSSSSLAAGLGGEAGSDAMDPAVNSSVPVPEMGTQVQITVAIEAVEDEDNDCAFLGALEGGGSCSEDDRHDKYSGAATSGGENDNDELDPNWKPPDSELIEKLIVQIEYYLSDENLEKDAFLLKHVRRNKMGYVSVKLLTSFKKVKHLTRDWRTTAYALRFSDTLELNEDSRKIRRKSPVPVFPSENLPSKMLLVHDFHLFPELQSLSKEQENGGMQEKIMEQLLKVFGLFGVISSVRILKPGRDLPPDVKRFSSRYSQVGTKECAIVEYEEVEAAIKAHEAMGTMKENEGAMKVILIGMKPPKKKIPKDKSRDEDSSKNRKAKSLNKRVEELQYVGEESPVYSSSDPDSNPTSPMMERKYKVANKLSPITYQNNHLSPNASPRSSPWNSPSGQRKVGKLSPLVDGMSPEIPRKCTDYSSDSSITPSSSPWVQRRRQAQTVTQEKSPVGSPMLGRKIQNADGLPLGVLRLPKGPDGTRGFHNGSERNKPMQNLETT
ncbi:la-related protein 6 [Ambystoma mexicanum]|uniref:la-related protein 6 n=1 Tax=Ambystoma mexicanum TaxID=8296 RepID=UPI0037E9392D